VSRVVVVGAGAREHALAWSLAKTSDVIVTPGNAGMAAAGLRCVSTSPADLSADLFVIGPELPLVAGLADTLRAQDKVVFGPGAAGARLEGSKAYLKEFLAAANVPTAAFGSFSELDLALEHLRSMTGPYVIKTDGLAAGKGVLVTPSLADAESDVREKLSGVAFGPAGRTIVIEEALVGEECSLLVLCDGVRGIPLMPAQDFKRVGDGDRGPNTGGMGAFAPLPSVTPEIVERVMSTIINPTLRELRRRDIDFRGVLYAGLMLTDKGPYLLEYNVRFGDPETQAIVALMGNNLFRALHDAATGNLHGLALSPEGAAVSVVLAAEGYPSAPVFGAVISGLDSRGQLAQEREGVTVFHAGTTRNADGDFVTSGGRVLTVTAQGPSVAAARQAAYAAAATVSFEGMVQRSDIAQNYSKESA